MPIPSKTQETCPNCGWKNKYINSSDNLIFFGGECPICKTETKLIVLKDSFPKIDSLSMRFFHKIYSLFSKI